MIVRKCQSNYASNLARPGKNRGKGHWQGGAEQHGDHIGLRLDVLRG